MSLVRMAAEIFQETGNDGWKCLGGDREPEIVIDRDA